MNPAENYILNQSVPFRSILMHLHAVIEHTISEIDLKYKYRVPFYYVEGKPFCYMNQSKDYIDLGFWKGAHINVHQEQLTAGRRVIRSLRYTSLEEINDEILIDILKDAFSIRHKKFYS
jgi:hypothetical protein